jgi:hypothetical protein
MTVMARHGFALAAKLCRHAGTNNRHRRSRANQKGTQPMSTTADSTCQNLYARAEKILGPNSARLASKLLAAKGNDVSLACRALEVAATKVDPRQYVGGILRYENRTHKKSAAAGPCRVIMQDGKTVAP